MSVWGMSGRLRMSAVLDSRETTEPPTESPTGAGLANQHGTVSVQAWLVKRYGQMRGARFLVFCAIGGTVFLIGFSLQALLTSRLRVSPEVSYVTQAIMSISLSFVLNRWLTWRDRDTTLWKALGRFTVQKALTVTVNAIAYVEILRLGVNYLLANILLTAAFMVINFAAANRLVFVPSAKTRTGRADSRDLDAHRLDEFRQRHWHPPVTVVIPCRNNERTIRETVESLLAQDYPNLHEVVLVGSPGDTTWSAIADIDTSKLIVTEVATPPGLRDANFKRHFGISSTRCDLIALVDSDVVLPPDWMTRAVARLQASGVRCVTGGMRSIHDSFWGRFSDNTRVGAKTPRIRQTYLVTKASFGTNGQKPPITASTLFTRQMHVDCPIDPNWSHGSYEDYEWYWRVVCTNYSILVCDDLFAWHHHRQSWPALVREYLRSARGCAYFVRAHRECPLAKRRLRQVIGLPFLAAATLAGSVVAIASGYGKVILVAALVVTVALGLDQVWRSRSLESATYPAIGLTLTVAFAVGLLANLAKPVGVSVTSSVSKADPNPTMISPLPDAVRKLEGVS